jgi:hypothetical protein
MAKFVRNLVAAALLAGVAAGASAAVLVVRSSGPSASVYPPGKAIPESTSLKLKANDVIVLLDSRGTRTLRGPGDFSASASAGATASNNAPRRSGGISRIQAVRGGPTGATQGRNIWQADVARSGAVCVANPSDLGLYRAGNRDEADVILTAGTGKQSVVHFEPGQSIARWPADLAVASGAKFNVKGGGANSDIVVKMLGGNSAGMEAVAQDFIRNDCQAQLDVLIDTFTAPQDGSAS